MLTSLSFFFAAGFACELVAINRNGRRKIKQQDEMILLLRDLLQQKNKST